MEDKKVITNKAEDMKDHVVESEEMFEEVEEIVTAGFTGCSSCCG
ncbi:hypothetical protein R2R35_08745 [Anaerocolumna sp. AGMB13020]|nr:hypothetical protein [Anaerocolumna sp. AGMB13020]WOO38576.1 hypothetical protein R2R35_08745 [Anaerocolumna sp. AGMB13020]